MVEIPVYGKVLIYTCSLYSYKALFYDALLLLYCFLLRSTAPCNYLTNTQKKKKKNPPNKLKIRIKICLLQGCKVLLKNVCRGFAKKDLLLKFINFNLYRYFINTGIEL